MRLTHTTLGKEILHANAESQPEEEPGAGLLMSGGNRQIGVQLSPGEGNKA